MDIPIYQIDAFEDGPFTGNPAAVCLLDTWLEDSVLQAIAEENNLSETVFIVLADRGNHQLRWFTPTVEVDLCGHATLAAAYVVHQIEPTRDIVFDTRSGPVTVAVLEDGWLELDFPAQPPVPCELPPALRDGLEPSPVQTLRHDDYIAVYPKGTDLTTIKPDLTALAKIDLRGIIITTLGDKGIDYFCRFFAPACGIDEDPVTGSAQCSLVPFWSGVLGKTDFTVRQLSPRGGLLRCQNLGDRVRIAGRCRPFLEGTITITA